MPIPFLRSLLVLSLAALTAGAGPARTGPAGVDPVPREDPEERAPSADAPAGEVFQSLSKNGLRYTWVLPPGYDGKTPRDLSLICHGTGLDYRWGHWNNKPGIFRPDDVVVSVDGPSPGQGDTRLFLGEKKDVEAIRAFLEEMRALFAVKDVFLYGHSQGGFFVVYYAGEHPETVAGVVAHASGAWNGSRMDKRVQKVAIAFMHGTLDPVVPYRQSPGSRDAYAKAGFDLLHLRRLQNYNHWPNAVRATECIDWCEGMTTADPETALACARRLLTVKKPDEYQWETAVDFSGARDVLRRFEPKAKAPLEGATPAQTQAALALAKKLEAHAAKHVAALRKQVAKKADLTLDKAGDLGHLVALREDFRGVDAVEEYMEEIGFDKEREGQSKAVGQILDAWYDRQHPEDAFGVVLANLRSAFLFEGFPPELAERMKEWRDAAAKDKSAAKTLKRYPDFEAWRDGWSEGLKAYAKLWEDWKSP